jgi:hypothetical protein
MLCKAVVAIMICIYYYMLISKKYILLYAKAIGSLVLTTIYPTDDGILHLFSTVLIIRGWLMNHSRYLIINARLAGLPTGLRREYVHWSSCIPTKNLHFLGLVRFRGIQSGRNNKCRKNIMIWTRFYSGSKINLPIMIGRTRDRRAELVPHLLTSGLIPSLLVYLSWAN